MDAGAKAEALLGQKQKKMTVEFGVLGTKIACDLEGTVQAGAGIKATAKLGDGHFKLGVKPTAGLGAGVEADCYFKEDHGEY